MFPLEAGVSARVRARRFVLTGYIIPWTSTVYWLGGVVGDGSRGEREPVPSWNAFTST